MNEQVPKKKQTVLGLYVTSAEAYDKWQATPDKVKLLDVRTPEEFIFVGHPEMAQCIPLGFQSYRWDEKQGYFDLDVNKQFVPQVQERFDPDETLMLLCRSGGRSAMAVNILVQSGYTDVWNITDGMEGDLVDGKRTKNGWKNAGLPWTYQVDPALIEAHGVVSEPVAEAMAEGARRALGVDVAVGVTGSAGPDPLEQPSGTMAIAVATPSASASSQSVPL